MSQKVGDRLKHDFLKLRFTTTQPNGQPKQVLKRSLNQAVSEIIQPSYISHQTPVILYELLDVSISELETKRSLKVFWTGRHNKEEGVHPFLLPKTTTVNELAGHLAESVTLTGTRQIHIFGISKDGKRQEELNGLQMIGNLPDASELFAEVCFPFLARALLLMGAQEVPQEELDRQDGDKLISVYHFYREPARAHGVPFKCVVKPVCSFPWLRSKILIFLGRKIHRDEEAASGEIASSGQGLGQV